MILKIPEPCNIRPYNQRQMDLFPPSVRSLIADNHLYIIINDVVNVVDLSCLYKKVSREGNPPYHPAMMLKILFYAYAKGIFSSRKIADAVADNIGFIFLAAWQRPDFRTISDFRKNNLKELEVLFVQIVQLCEQLGMVKLGHVAIDGTKIKANASDANTYDSKRIEREIARWIEQADAVDQKEDHNYGSDKTGDEIPEDIRDRQRRLEKLKELKQQLEQSGREKINRTDVDAVFMKTNDGIQTAYNAQTVVDSPSKLLSLRM